MPDWAIAMACVLCVFIGFCVGMLTAFWLEWPTHITAADVAKRLVDGLESGDIVLGPPEFKEKEEPTFIDEDTGLPACSGCGMLLPHGHTIDCPVAKGTHGCNER